MYISQFIMENVNTSTLVDLKSYPFKLDYSEVKFFNKKYPKILLDRKTANALLAAQNDLPKGYKFVINSGYRGYDDQYAINEYMKKKLQKQYPNNWEKMLNIYTGGDDFLEYIKNTPSHKQSHMSHASGKAVDIIGIINNKNQRLDMGGQHNDKRDQINYYKSGTIAKNRKLLKDSLTKNKFENFKDEWWHWGYYG